METALSVAADHPAYPGHFPGNPILPGVVVLAEAIAAVASATGRAAADWTIANAKFLSPVTPGTALTLAHEAAGNGGMRFEVRAGTRLVAVGTFVPLARE